MTKKEQAAFAVLEEQLAQARAFRRTEPVEPDVPPPTEGHTTGFLYNWHSQEVYPAWSGVVVHGTRQVAPGPGRSSQGRVSLFSTQERAWRAMRYEVENEATRTLARIDARIQRCLGLGHES